jgi:hypothetical protein
MADLSRIHADSKTDAYTPSKRVPPLKDMLSPLILQALPNRGSGMFPSEVAAKLLQHPSQLTQKIDLANFETQVRIVLKKEYELKKVSRTQTKGPKGGRSHRYMRRDSSEDDSNVGLDERVSQLSADVARDSRDRAEHSHTHASGSTCLHRQPSEAFHVAQDSQQDPPAESIAESSRLGHTFDTPVLQDEQGGAERVNNSNFEAHSCTHEHGDIMENVLATKLLFAQLEKITGEINRLESQQSLARNQYSDLGKQATEQEEARETLLAEAQMWREQAAEAERKALSHQKDAERLKEEAENQRGILEDGTSCINIAREDSTRLAKQVRKTVEETVGGDLVNLLSLCTPRASD